MLDSCKVWRVVSYHDWVDVHPSSSLKIGKC